MYFVWFPKCPYRALSQTLSKCGTPNSMNSEKQGQEHTSAGGRVFSKYRWSIFGLSVLFIERDSWEGLQKSLWKTRLGNAVCDKQKYDVTKRSCKEPHSWVVGPWLWRSAQAILPFEWEGKWDDAAGIWIKDEWARCLLLVLFAQNYCQRHCKRGHTVHPCCFWKLQHPFLPQWLLLLQHGSDCWLHCSRQKSLFSPIFCISPISLHFFHAC